MTHESTTLSWDVHVAPAEPLSRRRPGPRRERAVLVADIGDADLRASGTLSLSTRC